MQKQLKSIMVATWIWNGGVDERNDKIWILQARPETDLVPQKKNQKRPKS